MEGLQATVIHDLIDVIIELLLAHQTVLTHCLADDLAHGHTGLQRGEGILEDDLHLRAHIPHFLVREGIHVLTVKQHLTAVFSPARRRMVRPVVVLPQPDSPTRPRW